jgi:hypothetical protein
MIDKKCYVQNRKYEFMILGKYTVLFKDNMDKLHILNETASEIFNLFHDKNTVDNVIELLTNRYAGENINSDIIISIERLIELGLIVCC